MRYRSGFTIIEVVLFLALSGGMAALLFAGTGVAIQSQQYLDSVRSFSTFFTSQYSEVINVENERPDSQDCPISGVPAAPRGQSDCVIVGRYISTEDSGAGNEGRVYLAYPLYSSGTGDVRRYSLGPSDLEYEVNWGVRTRLSDQSDGSSVLSVLIYRHPDHGTVSMQVDGARYHSGNIENLIDRGADTESLREICIYDRGWLPTERRSVFLGAQAGSSDAITISKATGACSD